MVTITILSFLQIARYLLLTVKLHNQIIQIHLVGSNHVFYQTRDSGLDIPFTSFELHRNSSEQMHYDHENNIVHCRMHLH